MASDTAPAAVPGPNQDSTTPDSPPAQGGLTGMLTPVEPARPATFNLDPTTDSNTSDQATAGASSAAFHNPNDPQEKGTSGGSSRQERSVMRAWLLAGAERWKQGGAARLKRLDIQKAKAQARQVKENVTVNRAEKIVGGNTNSSTGNKLDSGKSLNSKAGNKSAGGGSKNTPGNTRNGSSGPSGSSGSGGRGSSGGSHGTAGAGGRGSSGNGSGRGSQGGSSGSKNDPQKRSDGGHSKGPGGGKGSAGHGGTSGKSSNGNSKSGGGKGPGSPNSPKSSKDTPRRPGSKSSGETPGRVDLEKKPKQHKGNDKQEGTTSPKQQGANDPKSPRKQPPAPTPGTNRKNDTGDKASKNSTPDKATPAPSPAKADRSAKKPRVNTQPSRETGYRDGTRAAKVVAHAEAWRDGYQDGYRDTKQAADTEKTRLDKAHADLKQARTQPEKDQPVTKPVSSADYQPPTAPPKPDHAPGPQPVQVTHADATHLQLGDGAARSHISHGEVRTLRSFQTRLDNKTEIMTRVGEATKALKAHADAQTKKVTDWLEQAKAIEGGDKLLATLTKLEEATKDQAAKAEELHKRALRGAEGCKVLHANTDTRYGLIYKAVQDAGEGAPAKMTYYKENAGV